LRAHLLYLAALLIVPPLAIATPASGAPSLCSISLTLGTQSIYARVSSSEGATDGVGGSVAMNMPPGFKGALTLLASTDTGWPVNVEPRSISGEGSFSESFFVAVTAPAAEPAGLAGEVKVEAKGSVAGVPCPDPDPAAAPVVVMPYLEVFNGQIPPDSVRVNGEAGQASFDIEVEVLSNARVDVAFNFRADPGISVDAPTGLSLNASGSVPSRGNISVQLRAPGLSPGPHDVSIFVKASAQQLPTHSGLLALTIYVPRGNSTPVPLNLMIVALMGLAAAAGLGWWWHRARVTARALERFERLRPPKVIK